MNSPIDIDAVTSRRFIYDFCRSQAWSFHVWLTWFSFRFLFGTLNTKTFLYLHFHCVNAEKLIIFQWNKVVLLEFEWMGLIVVKICNVSRILSSHQITIISLILVVSLKSRWYRVLKWNRYQWYPKHENKHSFMQRTNWSQKYWWWHWWK